MKSVTSKILALLLAALMVLPMLAACGDTGENNPDTTVGGAVTEDETEKQPAVAKKDYNDAEFVAIYCADTFNPGYFFIEEDERKPGNDMDDKVYERALNVEEYLGVDIIAENGGSFTEYTTPLKNAISAGDDSYQMVMTHVYMEVANLITSNYLRDFQDFESLQLEADYWNYGLMEDLSINDKMFCGYNDFCLTSVNAIVFNKDLMAEYNLTAPYEDVRNKTWTMDKLISLASNVAKDNGDGVWNEKDTYGISGRGWVDTISFTTACDIKIVDRDETGLYQVAYENNSEKTFAALEKVNELYNGDFAYYKGPQGTQIPFNDGTTMMYTMETYYMTNLRDVTFRFGVLPYPMYNEAQGEYKSLNWNGIMFVPASIKDPEMVGDVLELLAFYTPPVQKAYYEDLLGSKLSDAPEDAEMLDVIWDSVVTDIGMVSANLAGMDPLLYMFPNLCLDGVQGYSSYVTRNTRSANRALEKLFG